MFTLVNPRFFVSVHVEYRYLVPHGDIAQSIGIPESNFFVLEDGDVLELTESSGEVVDRVRSGHVFVDGHRLWDMSSTVLQERRRLARDGIISVAVTLSAQTGLPLTPPEIGSSGFVELNDSQELFEKTSKIVLSDLEDGSTHDLPLEQIKAKITRSISDFLYKETRRRPTVLTLIEKV